MLDIRRSYLQIAFNRSLSEVARMVSLLPKSDRILVEAGTPFIKQYGKEGIRSLKNWWGGYIVADLKCMDRGSEEARMASSAGASAATCLGLAPTATIDFFIDECKKNKIDSMVDMMNVRFPFEVLQKLKKLPSIVILHRGVDEGENREKEIPLYDIHRIRSAYNVLISVAGGETYREVRREIFNDCNIAVVWRAFYDEPEKTAQLAEQFIRELR
ncbi:MAG: orotidine 5'-phosphate decarboxylase / HUMPS family protein [bacterium]